MSMNAVGILFILAILTLTTAGCVSLRMDMEVEVHAPLVLESASIPKE